MSDSSSPITTTPKLRLDNLKRSCFITCPRKYYWQHKLHLRTTTGSTALRYGIAWHAAMQGYYEDVAKNGWTKDGSALEAAVVEAKAAWSEETAKFDEFYEDYRSLENLLLGLMQYFGTFHTDEGMLEIVEAERIFCISMEGSDNINCDPFDFVGRIDLEVMLNQRPWIVDHKTTSQSLSVQSRRLERSPQFMGYVYAGGKELSVVPDGALIQLCQLTAYKSKSTGNYGAPKFDFQRIPQIYNSKDIESWKESLIATALDIQIEESRGIWPMRLDNCYQYGECSFSSLCKQNTLEPMLHRFVVGEPWDPMNTVKEKEQK